MDLKKSPRRKSRVKSNETVAMTGETLFDRSTLKKRRREAIILAAAKAFNRTGFHNTSMDQIAAALQTSKPMLYQFFENKQKLLYACHHHAMDYGEEGLALARKTGRTGREKLSIFGRTYMNGIMTDFGACAGLSDVDSLLPADRADVIRRRARISSATQALIEEGQKDGSLAKFDSKLAMLFVLGVFNWILIWYRPDGDHNRDEIVDGFLAMLETGLTPR
jgi:TetR/AcrR family transcriptional regulator